ncbi:MAG TPA: hypothetical protein P5210_14120 [Draconibacterium sp.]|nr:hypothetical protein [Draconibacterium sp.]
METTKFKPVFIKLDHMEFERHTHLINLRLIPVLNQIKAEFLKLDLGPLTNEYLEDILFEQLQLIRSRLADKEKYENRTILSRIDKLLKEFSEPGNMEIPCVIGYPSVNDSGEIVFTDEAIQELKDFHSTYVCTEGGIELLELHRKAAEALNEFYQKAYPNIESNELGELFDLDPSGTIIPVFREYDLFKYARQS